MGYVYFIGQPQGSIKIGFTNGDPRLRLRALKYAMGVELKMLAAFIAELEKMRVSAQAWSPQSPTWNLDVVVRVRTTPCDERRWKLAADRAGMTLSEWIRKALNDIPRQRSEAERGAVDELT